MECIGLWTRIADDVEQVQHHRHIRESNVSYVKMKVGREIHNVGLSVENVHTGKWLDFSARTGRGNSWKSINNIEDGIMSQSGSVLDKIVETKRA